MIAINLLPKEMRPRRGGVSLPKSTLYAVASVAALVIFLVGTSFYQRSEIAAVRVQIAQAERRHEQMKDDIRLVDQLIEVKEKILKRLNAVESLDHDRVVWVRNLESLAAIIPDFLWLSEFRQGVDKAKMLKSRDPKADTVDTSRLENQLRIGGYCYTLNSLANFLAEMQQSPRYDDIIFDYAKVEEMQGRRVFNFKLACQLQPLTDEAVPGMESGATQPLTPPSSGTNGEEGAS